MMSKQSVSWAQQPQYVRAVRDLVLAHHLKDVELFREADAAIEGIGWNNGPKRLLNALVVEALNALHPGGFEGRPLDLEWYDAFNQRVIERHGDWLNMPEGLTLLVVQAARGFDRFVADIPGDILALRRAMLFEVAVDQLRQTDDSFDDALERWFAAGITLPKNIRFVDLYALEPS